MNEQLLQLQLQQLQSQQQNHGLTSLLTTRASGLTTAAAAARPSLLPLQPHTTVSTTSPSYVPVASTVPTAVVCVIPQPQLPIQPIAQATNSLVVGGGAVPGILPTIAGTIQAGGTTSYPSPYLSLFASQQQQVQQFVNPVAATPYNVPIVGTSTHEKLINSLQQTNHINSVLTAASQQRLEVGGDKSQEASKELLTSRNTKIADRKLADEVPSSTSRAIPSSKESNSVKRKRDADASNGTSASSTAGKNNNKHRRTKKPSDLPRRSLTAYNIFFQMERAKIVGESTDNSVSNNEIDVSSSRLPRKKRRKQPHNRVSFEGLAKMVSSRWKSLSAADRKPYEALAAADKIQNQKNIDEYIKRKLQEEEAERQKLQTSSEKR